MTKKHHTKHRFHREHDMNREDNHAHETTNNSLIASTVKQQLEEPQHEPVEEPNQQMEEPELESEPKQQLEEPQHEPVGEPKQQLEEPQHEPVGEPKQQLEETEPESVEEHELESEPKQQMEERIHIDTEPVEQIESNIVRVEELKIEALQHPDFIEKISDLHIEPLIVSYQEPSLETVSIDAKPEPIIVKKSFIKWVTELFSRHTRYSKL